ncbi:MAG: 30S ribosomal protein S6 [Deinococcales bacterium]
MSEATYDLNVILDPNLSEQQLQTEKDAVTTQVERAEGEILELDEWGVRRLAYPIRKLNDGYYLIYRLRLSSEKPKALETALRQRDNVMRVLVVKDRPEWKTRKESREKAEAEAGA